MSNKQPLKVFADFNNCDAEGRVRLNTVGSLRDLAEALPIMNGDLLDLSDSELRVIGTAEFSDTERIWTGRFDWNQLKEEPAS